MITIPIRRATPPSLGRCRACARLVEWVWTTAGRCLPMDAPLVVEREYVRSDGVTMTVIDTARVHVASCPATAEARRLRPHE